MKKMYYLMLCLLTFGITSMYGQVRVGSDKDPHAGALLDLRTNDESDTKGLLLPQVELVVADSWSLDGDAIAGMLVFNKVATENLPVGVYVWNGDSWLKMSAKSGNKDDDSDDGGDYTDIGNGGFKPGEGFDFDSAGSNIGVVFKADGHEWIIIAEADVEHGSREMLIVSKDIWYKTAFGGVVSAYDYESSTLRYEMDLVREVDIPTLEPYISAITNLNSATTQSKVDLNQNSGDMIKKSNQRVFALTKEEIETYFVDERIAKYLKAEGEECNRYWLRTTGSAKNPSYVNENGDIVTASDATIKTVGLRPAMWINPGMDVIEKNPSNAREFVKNTNKVFKADGIYWRIINVDRTTGNMLITSRNNLGEVEFNDTFSNRYTNSKLEKEIQKYNTNSKLKSIYPIMQMVKIPIEATSDITVTNCYSYVDEAGQKTAFALSVSDINTYFIEGVNGRSSNGNYWLRTHDNKTYQSGTSYYYYYYYTFTVIDNGIGKDMVYSTFHTTSSSSITGTKRGIRPAMFINFNNSLE